MPSTPSQDRTLITCASGKQATCLIQALRPTYKKLRLAVATAHSKERLKTLYPEAEVVQADLASPSEVRELFRGVNVCYYVGPWFHPYETECGYYAIDAAVAEQQEGRFEHFVYSSVHPTQLRNLLNHDVKRYIEERLLETELPLTVIKPTNFLNMFPIAEFDELQDPVYKPCWNPDIAHSFTILEDLGECTKNIIDEREEHLFLEYPLCNTLPTPYIDLVRVGEKVLGKKITVREDTFENNVRTVVNGLMKTTNASQRSIDSAERMLLYCNRHSVKGNSSLMRKLLGREPQTIEQWMTRSLEAHRPGSKI